MSLESVLFRRDFYYNLKFVEKCIKIIQTSTNEKRVKAYKSLVFKMMKDIVKKNVTNYLNLLRNVDYPDIPERDELISDCYVVFDKCVSKFLVDRGYNFYFYFNKSLSRNFFREYYKKTQNNNATKNITDVMMIVNRSFHISEFRGGIDLLLDNLHFTDFEKRICHSKMNGQKIADFLKNNTDVSNSQYARALKGVRAKLLEAKQNKDI